jgi:hypothetical protein
MKQMHDFRERFDSLEQGGVDVQTIAQDERLGAGTVAELETYLPTIGEAFSTAFECEAPTLAITLSADPSDFPILIGADATHCDLHKVAAARASGGRSRFYHSLSEILPPHLLDVVGFEFKFPYDRSE